MAIIRFLSPTLLSAAIVLGARVDARAERQTIDGPVAAEVIRVIDGDTLLVAARPWPQQTVEVYVRLRGIDAPELHSKCNAAREAGKRAWRALETLTGDAAQISLTRITGDKYFGRIVADVTLSDGRNLASDLLSAGYVELYDGGRKRTPSCNTQG